MSITVLGGLAVLWYRKQVLSKQSYQDPGSLMDEFRRMRDSGEITKEEYEATRKAIALKLRGSPGTDSDKHAPDVRASGLRSRDGDANGGRRG